MTVPRRTERADEADLYGIGLRSPGIGHNSGAPQPLIALDVPVLNIELLARLQPQQARRDELLGACERFHRQYATIEDDDTQQRATDFVRQMKACTKEVEELRKFEKAPVLTAQRAIDSLFADFTLVLVGEIGKVEAKMTAFARTKIRLARERAEAEARQLREQAEAFERVALQKGTSFDDALHASEAADEAARRASASRAELSRVHSDLGGVASMRGTVRFRVVNFDAVPRRYLMLDADAVRPAGKNWQEGAPQPIPGVEFYIEERVVVR